MRAASPARISGSTHPVTEPKNIDTLYGLFNTKIYIMF